MARRRAVTATEAEERGRAAVVAREVALARGLAANSSTERARQLRRLQRWLRARSASRFDFSEHDFMRLWKGLFYCVWMSDKPLVQEQLCDDIAKLFDCFGEKNITTAVLFYRTFLKTLATDWFGIDQHRLDKFLMLVRRVTRGILVCAKKLDWNKESTSLIDACLAGEGGIFSSTAPNEARMSLGLKLHIVDCWMEEIAKVSEGDISQKAVSRLVKPFATCISHSQENRLISAIIKNIFIHLIRQTDLGIDYREKTHAWRMAGYPGGSVEAMQKVEESDESENEEEEDGDVVDEQSKEETPQKRVLDPRAGHVDVELAQLPVEPECINKIFRKLIADVQTSNSSRNKMKELIRKFEVLGSGDYPFKMKEVMLPKNSKLKMPKVIPAAYDLMEFERTAGEENDDEDLKGLNKRQKRRFLMKQRKKYLTENNIEDDKPTTTIIKQKNKLLKSGLTKTILRKQTKNIIKNCSDFTVTDNVPKKVRENGIGKKENGISKKVNGMSKKENGIGKKENDISKKENSIGKKENGIIGKENNIVKKQSINLKKDKNTLKKEDNIIKNNNENVNSDSKRKNDKDVSTAVTEFKVSPTVSVKDVSPKASSTPVRTLVVKEKKGNEMKKKIEKKSKNNYLATPNSKVIKGKITKPKSKKLSLEKRKKVDIDLLKNTHHTIIDYVKSVKSSPKIPFDSKKVPQKTSLKPNSMPSPVNPFYKKRLSMNFS